MRNMEEYSLNNYITRGKGLPLVSFRVSTFPVSVLDPDLLRSGLGREKG